MAELLGVMFCYLVIILQNKPRFQECVIFIILTIQCALSYCLHYQVITDIFLWMILNSTLDIVLALLVSFTHPSRNITILVTVTVVGILWNIISYLNINYYAYSLNLFITDHYFQGLLLLINIDRKYLNILIKILVLGTTLL